MSSSPPHATSPFVGIDIFKKKFVFVPINKDLHWSLCVIVNPGEIAKMYDVDEDSSSEHPWYVYQLVLGTVSAALTFS